MAQRAKRGRYAASTGVWPFVGAASIAVLVLAGGARPSRSDGATATPKATPEQIEFFEKRVRPVLLASCVSCHGKDAQLGGLRVDSRAALIKGGDGGPSIVSGDPEHSLLVTAVHQTGTLKMPQGGRLKDNEIADLTEWVKMGAPWPEEAPPMAASPARQAAPLWSLSPVKKMTPPRVKAVKSVISPIDNFILARLEAKKLTLAPPADKRTLLRRVTYDLIGLPPTQADTAAFLADTSSNAYEKVVDRLLASPHYGERWARLWLDVARYADTKGYVFTDDRNYYSAYTYREYVIRAFNSDMPYTQFITEQLAADLLPAVANGDDKRPLAALGYLTLGRRFINNRPDIIDDRIDVTMRGVQGLTVACARCHDHKFDPIPTQDYYSLYGIFDSTKENDDPISDKSIRDPWIAFNQKNSALENARRDLILAQVKQLRQKMNDPMLTASLSGEVKGALQGFRENEFPNDDQLGKLMPVFDAVERDRLTQIRKDSEDLKKNIPARPEFTHALHDENPHNVRIFKRGNPGTPGDEAPRRFLLALSKPGVPRAEWKEGSGRLQLARAIASRDNPLTARVFVNRVWMNHFGTGIVRTPSDFGRQGEKPTHPELLDYLASMFMESGWSVKKLHRRIVLSATYRQGADATPAKVLADPENRLLSHQNRRRLDLEQMRDSLMAASGVLDTRKVGGKSVDLWASPFTTRRAVYGFVERQNLPQTFRTFDFASPDSTSPQRFKTTVPQQALFFMNSPLVVEQAKAILNRPEIKNTTGAARIKALYGVLYGRRPDTSEVALGLRFTGTTTKPAAADATASAPVWQYGYGQYDSATAKVSAFTPFTVFKEGRWHAEKDFPGPQLGYVTLTATGGHAGKDLAHAPIRRWTASFDGVVSVSGKINHPSEQGDGIHAMVVSSQAGTVGEWTVHHSEAETSVATVTVKRGDTLDFIVDCRASDGFDSFTWAPVITRTGKPVKQTLGTRSVWDARNDFSGPVTPLPPPLGNWERYAQALLMSNEFMFID